MINKFITNQKSYNPISYKKMKLNYIKSELIIYLLMYFCPNCSYILDIAKSSVISKNDVDDKIIITKITDIFKLLDDDQQINNYKVDFSKDDLIKHKKYQKLKDNEKNKLNELFDENILSGAELKCDNCNYIKLITETILLYQINMDDTVSTINTIDENKLMTTDPLLPHTNDYICKNLNCITHKNDNLKNAIFYKHKNSYKVNYICCVCYYNW